MGGDPSLPSVKTAGPWTRFSAQKTKILRVLPALPAL